jgi:hypothetical protein
MLSTSKSSNTDEVKKGWRTVNIQAFILRKPHQTLLGLSKEKSLHEWRV